MAGRRQSVKDRGREAQQTMTETRDAFAAWSAAAQRHQAAAEAFLAALEERAGDE